MPLEETTKQHEIFHEKQQKTMIQIIFTSKNLRTN